MSTRSLVVAALFALGTFTVGCPGDPDSVRDGGTTARPDAGGGGQPDGGGGGTPDGGTEFAAFLSDLIQNQTAENTDPVEVPDSFDDLNHDDQNAFDQVLSGP